MRFVFFLITFLYSFIFYVFYTFSIKKDIFLNDINYDKNIINLSLKDSIIFSDSSNLILQSFFGNIIIESIIFFLIGIFLFIYFSSGTLEEEVKNTDKLKNLGFLEKLKNRNILNFIFYYFGFLLFYISLYLISLDFQNIKFQVFILILNIGFSLFYFLSKYSSFSQKLLRINSIIFSFYYIGSYFYISIFDKNFFNYIDLINGISIIFIFLILLYYDKKISKKISFDNVLILHFSLYFFSISLFYFYYYFFHYNILFSISIISFFIGILYFYFIFKIKLFENDKIIFKYIGIIFLYISTIFGFIFFIFNFNYIIYILLFILLLIHIFIHKKYINYISYFFGISLSIFLIYFTIFNYNLINKESINFLYFSLLLSFLIIIITYLLKNKNDTYFLYFYNYIILLYSIINYFIYNKFEFLYIGLLLFIVSLQVFLSYNRLIK